MLVIVIPLNKIEYLGNKRVTLGKQKKQTIETRKSV